MLQAGAEEAGDEARRHATTVALHVLSLRRGDGLGGDGAMSPHLAASTARCKSLHLGRVRWSLLPVCVLKPVAPMILPFERFSPIIHAVKYLLFAASAYALFVVYA